MMRYAVTFSYRHEGLEREETMLRDTLAEALLAKAHVLELGAWDVEILGSGGRAMTKLRLLQGVVERLKERHAFRDTEEAHAAADGDLIAAIDLLAKHTRYEEVAQQIVAAYAEVAKWYS